ELPICSRLSHSSVLFFIVLSSLTMIVPLTTARMNQSGCGSPLPFCHASISMGFFLNFIPPVRWLLDQPACGLNSLRIGSLVYKSKREQSEAHFVARLARSEFLNPSEDVHEIKARRNRRVPRAREEP